MNKQIPHAFVDPLQFHWCCRGSVFFIIVQKNISTFLGCQWNWILQMNKARTPENEHQILQWMKSNFSPWGKKEKEKDDSIRYFISYTDMYIENANTVRGS